MKTQRAMLRRFRADDYENMRKLESDPEVMRFTSYKVVQNSEQTKNRLQTLIENEKLHAPFGVWAVELNSGEFAGWFMLRKTGQKYPELGFMLLRDQWGKGLATEVAATLIEYGFKQLNLEGIAARTSPQNTASIQVLTKLGFIHVEGPPEIKLFHLIR